MYYLNFDDIPRNHYSVIYADCPWSYGDKMTGHSFSLDHEYVTMTLDDIKALPVGDVAARDSALLLWVTSPMVPDSLAVMKSWGYRYVTVAFCWVKTHSTGTPAVNLGRWTMGGCELCLLGRRGKIQRAARNVKQIVTAPRGRHSEKPAEVRARIETLFGEVQRIELFARGQQEGWDQFGNEPGCDCWDSHAIAEVNEDTCGCRCHRNTTHPQLAVPDVPEVDS